MTNEQWIEDRFIEVMLDYVTRVLMADKEHFAFVRTFLAEMLVSDALVNAMNEEGIEVVYDSTGRARVKVRALEREPSQT